MLALLLLTVLSSTSIEHSIEITLLVLVDRNRSPGSVRVVIITTKGGLDSHSSSSSFRYPLTTWKIPKSIRRKHTVICLSHQCKGTYAEAVIVGQRMKLPKTDRSLCTLLVMLQFCGLTPASSHSAPTNPYHFHFPSHSVVVRILLHERCRR